MPSNDWFVMLDFINAPRGDQTRRRLQRFYRRHAIDSPRRMQVLDAACTLITSVWP